MGTIKQQQLNAKDEKRSRAAERRETRRREKGTFDVAALPWATLVALMAELAANGGAIRIGLTRDGGALALGMYAGDDYATEYIRPNEDIEAALFEIAEIWLTDGLLGLERRMVQMGMKK